MAVWDRRPSLGLTLILATLGGIGIDRFYVGQVGLGFGLMIGSAIIVGLLVTLPVAFLSQLSLVIAILSGRTQAFMYGSCVRFAEPCTIDVVLAILWIFFMLLFVGLFIYIVVTIARAVSQT